MAEIFSIAVEYKGENREFEAELRVYGYTHKIAINIDGTEVIFEPDEERNYRAVLLNNESLKKVIDPALLEATAKELEATFK